jgi:hypothetical protein
MSKNRTEVIPVRELLDELEAAKTTRWQSDGPATDPDLTAITHQLDRVLAEVTALRADVRALTVIMTRMNVQSRGSRPTHVRRGL